MPPLIDPLSSFKIFTLSIAALSWSIVCIALWRRDKRQSHIIKSMADTIETLDSKCQQANLQRARFEEVAQDAIDTLQRYRDMKIMPTLFVWDQPVPMDEYSEISGPVYNGVALAFSVEDARRKVVAEFVRLHPAQLSEEIGAVTADRRWANSHHYRYAALQFAREPEFACLVSDMGAYAKHDENVSCHYGTHDMPDSKRERKQMLRDLTRAEQASRATA